MTKFSDVFMKQVQDFYREGKKQKKFPGDQRFTIDDVVEKFKILPNQAKRIIHVKTKGK